MEDGLKFKSSYFHYLFRMIYFQEKMYREDIINSHGRVIPVNERKL